MGQRADALGAVLSDFVEPGPKTARPGAGSIEAAGLTDEVESLYRQLGGAQAAPRLRPGTWDFTFEGWVVELDEENHFNRYRAQTLESPSYEQFGAFDRPAYRTYCDRFEAECSTHGGYWVNSSAEREFGPAGDRGDLTGGGSPRWKQRAFYDFLKDLAPVTDGIPVSRLSIWDTVSVGDERIQVGRLLKRGASALRSTAWAGALHELASARTVHPLN